MNIQQYQRIKTPLNILELLELPVLDNLLNGHSFALRSGITVLYPTARPPTLDTLERRDARNREKATTFRPLCKYWRESGGCNQEDFCVLEDNKEALKFFEGECSGPRLYCCAPLGLWDMNFPLRIESNIIGILFGGQIAVKDISVNWQQALSDYSEYVDLKDYPDNPNHNEYITTKIRSYDLDDTQERKLIDLISDDTPGWEPVSVEGLIERFESFLKFGKIIQDLLSELHKAKKTAAEQQLLHGYDEDLANISLSNPSFWWTECERLLKNLTKMMRIEDIRLYVRERSRYVCVVPGTDMPDNIKHLPARDVVPSFSPGKLVQVEQDNKDVGPYFGFDQSDVWGYRSNMGTGSENCSTLIVFQGTINETGQDFLAHLCKETCTAADFVQLFLREREVDKEYRRKVALIGHSFRTPLQALLFDLEDLERYLLKTNLLRLREIIKHGIARIWDAREDLRQLLETADQKEEVFNLVDTMAYVLRKMESIAQNHPCKIVKRETWPDNILIQGHRYEIQSALTCLLDNAIKYSYSGWRPDTRNWYEVNVSVTVTDGYVKLTMVNYGIGIPKEKLASIREYGARGNVPDEKKSRLGTGLGLPFAIDAFENSGGWIDVRSVPANSATEEEIKTHHRYVTTVAAMLPIWKER